MNAWSTFCLPSLRDRQPVVADGAGLGDVGLERGQVDVADVVVGRVGIRCGRSVSGDAARRRGSAASTSSASKVLKSADTSAPWVAMVRRSCIGTLARPGPPYSRFRLAASPYSLAMCRKMSLPLTRVGLDAVEFVADGRRDLEPGAAGAHDRVHLGRPEPAGRGVVGAAGAGVRVGAGQHFSGAGQPVLGDDLVADAVPADVVEALDAEVGGELAGACAAGGVLDRRCGHGVVHHDRRACPGRGSGGAGSTSWRTADRSARSCRRRRRRCHRRDTESRPALRAKIFSMMVMPMTCSLRACLASSAQPLGHADQVEEVGGAGGQVGGDVGAVELRTGPPAWRRSRGQRIARMNGDGVAQLLQSRRGLDRCHAAEHQVDQQGSVDLAGDALDLARRPAAPRRR